MDNLKIRSMTNLLAGIGRSSFSPICPPVIHRRGAKVVDNSLVVLCSSRYDAGGAKWGKVEDFGIPGASHTPAD
jgi:hypothetical protein